MIMTRRTTKVRVGGEREAKEEREEKEGRRRRRAIGCDRDN